jgi:hypothetical protein
VGSAPQVIIGLDRCRIETIFPALSGNNSLTRLVIRKDIEAIFGEEECFSHFRHFQATWVLRTCDEPWSLFSLLSAHPRIKDLAYL